MFAEQIVCLNLDFVSTNRYKLGYRYFFPHFKGRTVQRSRGIYKINASMVNQINTNTCTTTCTTNLDLQSRLDLLLRLHSLHEGQYTEV